MGYGDGNDKKKRGAESDAVKIMRMTLIAGIVGAIITATATIVGSYIQITPPNQPSQALTVFVIQTFINLFREPDQSFPPTSTPQPLATATDTPVVPTSTPFPTLLPPTNTPFPTIAPTWTPNTSSPSLSCREIFSQDGIPNGGTYQITVEPNQFHIFTSGEITVSYNGNVVANEQGGSNRGSVSVFYPVNGQTTTYTLTGLVPNNNWHGIYENCSEASQQGWINNKVNNMSNQPNCPQNNGCSDVEVSIYRGTNVTR